MEPLHRSFRTLSRDVPGAQMTNPYVGPRPLNAGDPIFGREREIAELAYLLSSERIVLLYSPSGAGKSSLIEAGLLPRIQPRFSVLPTVRVGLPPSTSANRFAQSVARSL